MSIVDSLCGHCDGEFKRNEKYILCSGLCEKYYHKGCATLSDEHLAVLLAREDILWFCNNCLPARKRDIYEDIESIVKKLNEVSEDVLKLKKVVDENCVKSVNKEGSNAAEETKNYADVCKSKQQTMVIKPIDDDATVDAIKMEKALKSKIQPEDLKIGVIDIRKVKKGVAVSCATSSDRNILKEAVESKLGDKFKVQMIDKRKPKVKIVGMDKWDSADALIAAIRRQNSEILTDESYIKAVIIKKMKVTYMAILEVDHHVFTNLTSNGTIKVGWKICKVFEDVGVLRCYKCHGFNHKAEDCTKEDVCFKCGDNSHVGKDCKEEINKCVNCAQANEQFNLKLDDQHSAYDYNCTVFKRAADKQKSKIDYGQ